MDLRKAHDSVMKEGGLIRIICGFGITIKTNAVELPLILTLVIWIDLDFG
jgi:hypothetical protein